MIDAMFKNICCMSQKDLKEYLGQKLTETHQTIVSTDGYIYAQGDFPVLLVAHLDTVHKSLPQKLYYDRFTKSISSPQGIGGDDRCGVYMILKIAEKFNCSVLFCEDEEIGAIGAEKFTQAKFAKELKFNYIIELDRRGYNDAVFYDCDNDDFEDFITKDFYKTSFGSFSDISVVAPFLKCAAVNLSCGYYNAHTVDEYVVIPEMERGIQEVCKILQRTTDKDKFEYIEAYDSRTYNYNSKLSAKEVWYIVSFINEKGQEDMDYAVADSYVEAIGVFCQEHPHIPYANVLDIEEDFYDYADDYYYYDKMVAPSQKGKGII